MNRYLVTTKDSRRFVVTAETPEVAKSRIENKQEHKSPWSGAVEFTEDALPVQKVMAMLKPIAGKP